MQTRAKNADQHPGHVQRKPRQPGVRTVKAKKAEATKAAKAAKAAAKTVNSARLAKYEGDAMEREDMLDVTPRPNFTPAAGRSLPPASEPSAAGSVLESEVDTDEVNPDKATYEPGSTTEDDDAESMLSALPTSPAKRSYAEVASPRRKGGAANPAAGAAGAKAAPATKATKPASTKLPAAQPEAASDSATESDSLPPPSPRRKATTSSTTQSKTQSTAAAKKKVKRTGSASQPESLPPPSPRPKAAASTKNRPKTQPTATSKKAAKRTDSTSQGDSLRPASPSQSFDPRTPAPAKRSRRPPPSPTVSETEPDSPPVEPKARSLQRLGSVRDLADLDDALRRPKPKKLPPVNQAVSSSKASGKDRSEASGTDPSAWRSWKPRQVDDEEQMDVDSPVKATIAVPVKEKTKEQKRIARDQKMIIVSESDGSEIEIVEDSGKGKGKEKAKTIKGKGKGKGKATVEEDAEMDSMFIVPTLPPTGKSKPARTIPNPNLKRSHKNVDGDGDGIPNPK